MKKVTLMAAFFALLMGSFSTPVAAQDCGSNWGDSCEWSLCDGKVKVGAEWLYWQTQQDNMSYVGLADLSLVNEDIFSGEIVEPKYNYTSGYRINIGYELPCNCWEANVIYTYMPTSSKKRNLETDENFSIFALSKNALVSNLVNQQSIDTFGQEWDLAINNVDVDIARTITFNECISIRPHAGFRALWYTDKQKVFATGAFEDNNLGIDPVAFTNSYAEGKNKFTGYGIEAGLWGSWQIGCGFSIIGHFGGSILYSKFKVEQILTEFDVVEGVEEPNQIAAYQSHDHITTATPTVDYFIGLQFADQLCDLSFAVRLGWEQHVIFDTNRIFGNGNLSAQGLTLGMEVGF